MQSLILQILTIVTTQLHLMLHTKMHQDPHTDQKDQRKKKKKEKKLPFQLLTCGTPQEILVQKTNEVHPQ